MNSMDAGDAAQMTMWLLTEAPKQESAMQRNRVPDQDLRCFSDACRPHLQREHRSLPCGRLRASRLTAHS